jgi:CRP-like cAMP-binding protein
MGAATQLNDGIVQGAGSAWRMSAEHLLVRFQRNRELQRQLLRFTDAFITQVSQTAACNRAHDMEPRLARWLLMMQDRVAAPQIHLTQQFLARMLGARTASVNEAVQKLEAAGLIGHRRQEISILDREGLERAACECYGIVRRVYNQALMN